MAERVDVVVIGGGQAGLATSYELTRSGVEHVVLERGRLGQTWRDRWDSFCLVTPNWATQLPGHPYDGSDPDGYLPRDGIVAYLERYSETLDAPVREGVDVASLHEKAGGGFELRTSAGDLVARTVVVATGAYQRPHRPPAFETLPADLPQVDVDDYRNPGSLPSGSVLVVGSGQSGCQIAEELLEAGREVFVSCGKAPWVPRRIGDRDIVWWFVETGFFDATIDSLSDPLARLAANPQATGHGGGHDLNYRTLRAAGITLLGRFLGAEGRRARFADDLGASVAWGDERYGQIADLVRGLVRDRRLAKPGIPVPRPFDAADAPLDLDLSGFGAVVFAGGFRPEYGNWIHVDGAFDDLGFPRHADGQSVAAPGLFFVGVHFLRKRKSSLLYGVGEDAAIVASGIAASGGGASIRGLH